MVSDDRFPLWLNDGKFAIKHPDKQQISGIEQLKEDINNGKLHLRENHCLCQNDNPEKDICLSEKDRYGLPIPQLLCSKCGVIRSAIVFDDTSNTNFYKNYYRSIYNAGITKDNFWIDQCNRGQKLLNLFNHYIGIDTVQNVAEVGCGAGGVLWAFKVAGKQVEGFDFDTDFLSYGLSKGLNLHFGDFDEEAKSNYDLVILSHVLEHFLNPIDSLQRIINKVNDGKYLLVEVPGILNISDTYFNPITYFQNAHIYNFYYDYLKVFFEKLGLIVVYGDEKCDFIVQKPQGWKVTVDSVMYDPVLSSYPQIIQDYIMKSQQTWRFRLFSRKIMTHELWMVANKLGWQKIRPFLIRSKE